MGFETNLLQPIEPARILRHDFSSQSEIESRRQSTFRRIEVPVGIVCGKHQPVVGVDVFQQLLKVTVLGGLFHRLGAEPKMFPDGGRRPVSETGDFIRQFPPAMVQPPHERGQPGKAAFDQGHF